MLDRARRRDGLVGLLIGLLVAMAGLTGGWQPLNDRISSWGMQLSSDRPLSADISLVEVDPGRLPGVADDAALATALGEALLAADQARPTALALLLPPGWPLPALGDDEALRTPLLLGLAGDRVGQHPFSPRRQAPLPDYLLASTLPLPRHEESLMENLGRQSGLLRGQPPRRYLASLPTLHGVQAAGLLPEPGHGSSLALARVGEAAAGLPALSLQLAALLEGQTADAIQLDADGLRVAGRSLAVDNRFHYRPFPYRGQDEAFPRLDFQHLQAGEVATADLAGQLIIIAPTHDERHHLAALTASHASAIHAGHVYAQPAWGPALPWAALVAVLLWLTLVLPRLNVTSGLYLGLLLAVGLFGLQFLLPTIRLMHLELAMPLVALVGGQAGLLIKRVLDIRQEGLYSALSEANRQLAESLRRQGQTDAAFERLKRCPATGPVLESLYELGLDLERRREFARAQGVHRHIESLSPGFRDSRDRIRKLAELETRTALGNRSAGGGTLVMPDEDMQKPMLGRYEIERELGRGAMGVVYLGHDPRIGRTVAIKTMALSQEFEGSDLEQVTERFFREAETAGRLQHPGIVTIYDVGEEADLAYIAMDYLDGKGLQHYTDPGRLLPPTTACDIVIQVAEALDYAHGRNVVHRDIKPANMIYLPESRRVVLTDFGVACLTDSRRTKTGTILGTPSYMSPEQVLGRKVDGRSDLFSLGVTLYQMLRGELPFEGEPLATLLYKIANDKTPNVRRGRSDLPPCLDRFIKRALAKKPDERFASGAEMATALRRCRKEVAARQPSKSEEAGATADNRGEK